MPDPLDYPFWLASRSAGVVAYILLSASVVLGLAMALRLAPVRELRVFHERIALLALGVTAAHGLFLLPDGWLKPTVTQLLVPFAGGYRPLWTGLGILAAYGAVGLSLTYYARRRLGQRRWRNAHRFIPIAWAFAAAHVIGAGTDVVSLWLEAILAATIAAITVLLVQRGLAGRTQPAGREPARAGGGTAGTEPAPSGPAPDRSPPERKYAGELGLSASRRGRRGCRRRPSVAPTRRPSARLSASRSPRRA